MGAQDAVRLRRYLKPERLQAAGRHPRPIAWVTTKDVDGTLNAAPFSFFNAMSGNPPVLAFGIGGRAPGDVKDTGGNIRRTGQYVINLCSFELAGQMNVTAIDFPKNV